MPSVKNPILVVGSGPGKLPAGTVTASALLFPPGGGGSEAALTAHIIEPIDAHRASAIGINPTNAAGLPILATVGGPVDGESVLDFIDAAKDLFPVKPNAMGFDNLMIPNTGLPDWDVLEPTTGGFTRGSQVVYTHFLEPSTVVASSVSGMIYPADRGVLAVYYSTAGDYSTGTLVAALWLGSTPSPAGVPPVAPIFVEASRAGEQTPYVASGAGLDHISLQYRIAYLQDYSGYSVPWEDFNASFFRYQIAAYSYPILSVASGDAGSWLLVHWREGYATSLAAIQPSQLPANLNSTNCYSATTPDFDTAPALDINRHNVFVDAGVVSPSGTSFDTSIHAGGGPPAVEIYLSGTPYYTGVNLAWDVNIQASGLFDNSYWPGTTSNVNGPPAGFESTYNPITVDVSDFGCASIGYRFSQIWNPATFSMYSTSNPPAIGGGAHLQQVPLGVVGSWAPTTPMGGYGRIRAVFRKPFVSDAPYVDSSYRYMFNSYPQTGTSATSTDTFEPFNDEQYRYNDVALTTPTKPIIPTGGDAFDSTVVFVTGDGKMQVCGGQTLYPQVNYSSGLYLPHGPNYAALGDAANHHRTYVRAFNTGVARNTGRLRIHGLAAAAFEATAAFHGNDSDHPNGAIVEIKVPGLTGWLDLGRDKGNPDFNTLDGHGCRTGISVSGSDVIVSYDTTEFTATNGPANGNKYLVFVRITFMNSAPGLTYCTDEIEWLVP